ncbi:serine/threonine-protein kinase Smg1-like isoform X2 [Phlebotomus papatasi]|uniref:serine/threonine-protein kinase Smg1-like isoform X2 n=1 Tax=Phlebotomus papatasi TaxID=29031 RepID=UPI0024847002|nr:serine/threonine-protein kinase Smg1-like isoform X2 [Phlebotomus papatasi]
MEENEDGMTGGSGNVRVVRKSKVNRVMLLEKKHSSPDRYGSASNLTKTRSDASSFGFPEDMRISKLLSRLCAERNVEGALDLCGKLKGVIVDPTNANYIRRSFDSILESCLTVLKEGPEECQGHVIEILGKIGVVMRQEFHQFRTGILKNFKGNKNLRGFMMRILQVTLELTREQEIDLSGQIPKLLDSLKDFLEKTDNVEVFTCVSGVIDTIAGQYPSQFRPYFTDIVDILVGWHLETEQTFKVKHHCGKILENFRPFWLRDIKFTVRLLDQIIEDIVLNSEDLASSGQEAQSVVFASFVGAFNTILKCINVTNPEAVLAIGEDFLSEGYTKILVAAKTAILESPQDEEVVMTINETVGLFFDSNTGKFDNFREDIQGLIEIQLQRVEEYSPGQTLSLIFVILGYLRAMKTKISMEFIDLLVHQPHLLRERFSRNATVREALVKLWQEIVDVKNVAILEKTYSEIISELDAAMEVLRNPNGERKSMTRERGKFLVIFHLNSLARLAASSTSIIALYALKPSLLEMLTGNLSVTDELWQGFPMVHQAILGLLVAHCTNNGNFISSSGLLKGKVPHVINQMSPEDRTESPTSDNFEMILTTIDTLLKLPWIPQNSLNLILDWTHQLIHQSSAHCVPLKTNEIFSGIILTIQEMPIGRDSNITIKSGEILRDFLDKFTQVDQTIFPGLAEVCCIEMCSCDSKIREIYSEIFGKIPLNISLRQVNDFTGMAKKWSCHIRQMLQWHKSTATTNEIWPNHFRELLEGISFSPSSNFCDNLLREMFKRAWTAKPSSGEYSEAVLGDIRCLVAWIQWEAAQFCVSNKLRTPFGKPQETFLKIEAIVKEDARILDLKESSKVAGIETVIANQRHARILLGFMEALEKAIYNATEGTAFALPATEKPSRNFFHVNSSTCNEWFNRIRTAVDLVALHCMEPEMVIRYSESTIRNLVEAGKVSEPLFEHTLMSLAWALLRNGESDSLSGLYTWTKKVTGRRLLWVKMAAEQAAGHRETAARGYAEILEGDQKLDRHIREFIADQLVQCLLWSMQWVKLMEFLELEEAREVPRVTIPLINITSKQMRCLLHYEEDQTIAEECLSNWEILNEDTEFSNNFSYHHIISLAENTITCVFSGESRVSPGVLKTCSKIFQNGLQEALRTHSQEHLNSLTLLNHVCHKIARGEDSVESLKVDKVFGSLTLIKILYWAEFFSGACKKVDADDLNAMLRLDMVSMARKEGNLQMCKRELEKYYSKSFGVDKIPLEAACEALVLGAASGSQPDWSVNLGRAVYETSKWLYCFPEKREFAVQFAAAAALGIRKSSQEAQICERGARILLTISEWLIPEDEKLLTGDNPLSQLLKELPDYASNNVVPKVDLAIGKLIGASVRQCPDLAKAWNTFGGWCYKWGRKMVENRPSSGDSNNLFQPEDISEISRAIPQATQEEISKIVAILSEHQVPIEIDDIEPGDGSSTEMLESHLRKIPSLKQISAEQLQMIIGIWRRAHKHVYGYYEMAADAYFKYLQLGTVKVDEDSASSVAATLRLLRLIVKHALGLQEVLEAGLASTPTSPWKVIIPQLFSRLNHHEPYVRRRVSELLCRVAEDSPHIIIFPAVVGAAEGQKSHLEESNSLSECFYSLLDTLSNQAADTVAQVQLLVRELRRVCILWDEMCLVAMSKVYVESTRKFSELDTQITKEGITDENYDTFAERYHQLMKPIVAAVDKLRRTISREAETKHESAFQEKFSKPIEELAVLLREPMKKVSPLMPWIKFKSLCGVFQQRVQKRSNYMLKMSDISPILAGLRETVISMPGIENSGKEQIHIRSVENMVQILNTKTKPKKLAFYGSDGNRYTYLFKGLEDLHLDERIMQFLSIANSMMNRTIDCNGNVSSYRARHYSVIPLGPQSGLISWVDGVLPIFSVYKKWQQREAGKPRKDREISQILRPSELFFSKLSPKLQERGMKVTDPRSTWPLEVLKEVLQELAQDTPKDLLSREFWCTSTTAAEWRQIVRNYSLSLAVMSVIGYIIGLGDRHLDNVLVNLSTGEIVHIDYNVCFEKGKTLRVPEKIPFRMTQNLENALGVTGIEGTFRLACENVLKALKRGRETLLTLLEAFVYDPLVDWAVGEDDDTSNGFVESKQTANAVQEKEMLKLRWSTIDALEGLKESVKPLEEVASELKRVLDEKLLLKRQLGYLKTINVSKDTSNLIMRRNRTISEVGKPPKHSLVVLANSKSERKLLQTEMYCNVFDYFKEMLLSQGMHQLYKEGYELCKEINESTMKELSILQDMFDKCAIYVDLGPFLLDTEIHKKYLTRCPEGPYPLTKKHFKLIERHISPETFSPFTEHINTFIIKIMTHNAIIQRNIDLVSKTVTEFHYKCSTVFLEKTVENEYIFYFLKEMLIRDFVNIKINHEMDLNYDTEFCNMSIDILHDVFVKDVFTKYSEAVEIFNNLDRSVEIFAKCLLTILQKIINDDSSILTTITTVSALQHDISLEQIIKSMEEGINDTDEEESSINKIGQEIQENFDRLIEELRNNSAKTSAKMLLLELYDLLPDMENTLSEIDSIATYKWHEKYQEIKEVVEAKSRMEIFTNPKKREILRRIWSLRKLESIIKLFTCTLQIACALRKPSDEYDSEGKNMFEYPFESYEEYITNFTNQIMQPFINYFGILCAARLLENRGNKNDSLEQGLYDLEDKALERSLYHDDDTKHAELEACKIVHYQICKSKITACKRKMRLNKVKICTLEVIGMANKWRRNEENCKWNKSDRLCFIDEIKAQMETINAWEVSIKKMNQELSTLLESVKKVQKSNKSTVLGFSENHKYAYIREKISKLVKIAVENYNEILAYETAFDKLNANIFTENFSDIWIECPCAQTELNEYEKAFMELLPINRDIDVTWIIDTNRSCEKLLHKITVQEHNLERFLSEKWENMGQQSEKLENLYENFMQLSTDLRGWLKSSLKMEGKHLNATKEYLTKWKNFTTNYENLIENLKKTSKDVNVVEILTQIENLQQAVEGIFEGPSELKKYHHEAFAEKSEDNGKLVRNKEAHQSLQKRNAYAVSVWRRIRMKLEGRDPEPTKRSTVPEQVDWMIREAMDIDNLAVLYEGWTPWV